MKVLIACEFSGTVRDAFIKRGHTAMSCDLLHSMKPGPHYKGDVEDILNKSYWDLMIAFPPCTYLCSSGARWFKSRPLLQKLSLRFIKILMDAEIDKICIENPIGVISTQIRKPDQIIQPWMFGHGETKATCLWLKNLPKLKPTSIVKERMHKIHEMPPSKERSMLRSITYPGIAKAMAEQWG